MTEQVPKDKNDESFESSDSEIKNPFTDFRFSTYFYRELHQDDIQESQDNDKSDQRRNRVYALLTVPTRVESFMTYGILQSFDHFLLVYTFLPLRCCVTCFMVLFNMFRKIFFGYKNQITGAAQRSELLKYLLVMLCTFFITYIDTSIIYHQIRGQSVIKLYIFFNMLEVADRLLSAVSQDAFDALSWASGNLGKSKINSVNLVWHFIGAKVCLLLHCVLMIFQVSTLNVAFNSHNKALLTIMMSNNFVELKGSVFKKFAKNNLFQMSCSDARERFHFIIMLGIVMFRNMSATGWSFDDFFDLLLDVSLVLIAEVLVDWVKHAFITKFNAISTEVYKEYTVSIAYDLLMSHQNKNNWDHFDLLCRRMGLTPLPLSCLVNLIIFQTVPFSTHYMYIPVVFLCLFLLKVVSNLILLKWAYSAVHTYEIGLRMAGATDAGGTSGQDGRTSPMAATDDLILPQLSMHQRKVHVRRSSEIDLRSAGRVASLSITSSLLPEVSSSMLGSIVNGNLLGGISNDMSPVDDLGALSSVGSSTSPLGGTQNSPPLTPARLERSKSMDPNTFSQLAAASASSSPHTPGVLSTPLRGNRPPGAPIIVYDEEMGSGNSRASQCSDVDDDGVSGTSSSELRRRVRTKSTRSVESNTETRRGLHGSGGDLGTPVAISHVSTTTGTPSEQMKQPLSDVDRFSMYSSQIV